MSPSRSQLLTSATGLCNAFASAAPLDELLSHFSTTHHVTAKEHGEPFLAPFIGRQFSGLRGRDSLETYFGLLEKYLTFEDMSFGEWVIDPESRKVSCKGRARFKWIEGEGNGQWWDEQFAYILDFDQDAKVTDYQVWSDSGAAYLARIGKLNDMRKHYEKEQIS
ncbi:unnamed protein product [Somion occarium]|uniref:SnoaL-like domain-containing protein n=1 Tax=Somion occarium TaxID=3059160 RepID=A0ABP1E748_9APHY